MVISLKKKKILINRRSLYRNNSLDSFLFHRQINLVLPDRIAKLENWNSREFLQISSGELRIQDRKEAGIFSIKPRKGRELIEENSNDGRGGANKGEK